MPPDPIELLTGQIRQAFDETAWHGPNLMGSVRGVSAALAVWRPRPDGHNIAELVVHAAYWKYRVVRLLTKDAPRSFGLRGSNFFTRDEANEVQWTADKALVNAWQNRLIAAVASFPAARLLRPSGRHDFTFSDVITGIASHDIYHAGQIRLIRRLHDARQ